MRKRMELIQDWSKANPPHKCSKCGETRSVKYKQDEKLFCNHCAFKAISQEEE